MPLPGDMPEESYVRKMIEDIREVTQQLRKQSDGFDRVLRGYNGEDGLLTDLSHVKRTAQENKIAIDNLRNSVDMLVRDRPDSELARTKWRVMGELAVALAAGLSLVLQFIGG